MQNRDAQLDSRDSTSKCNPIITHRWDMTEEDQTCASCLHCVIGNAFRELLCALTSPNLHLHDLFTTIFPVSYEA